MKTDRFLVRRLNSWLQVLVVCFAMHLLSLILRMYFWSGIPVQLKHLTETRYYMK